MNKRHLSILAVILLIAGGLYFLGRIDSGQTDRTAITNNLTAQPSYSFLTII